MKGDREKCLMAYLMLCGIRKKHNLDYTGINVQ